MFQLSSDISWPRGAVESHHYTMNSLLHPLQPLEQGVGSLAGAAQLRPCWSSDKPVGKTPFSMIQSLGISPVTPAAKRLNNSWRQALASFVVLCCEHAGH